jgi:hypothetical protein
MTGSSSVDPRIEAGTCGLPESHCRDRIGQLLAPIKSWSMVKSMTAMPVGVAVHDGALASIDEPLTRHLPELRGSAYDGVTLRHLMTMSSGARWNEDYTDRTSDVNRYSKSLADKVPGGVLALIACLSRAHPPGSTFLCPRSQLSRNGRVASSLRPHGRR